MKKDEVINVSILPDGTIEIDAVGFKGASCAEATKFLEQALGMDTSKRRKKPEFESTETVKHTQRA